jgi:hypothetical protein
MNSKTQFHVISGKRVVATRSGPSAREVALGYLRAMGCKRDEIIYYGLDGVSWRGAVYRAEPVQLAGQPLRLVELPPVSPPASSRKRDLRGGRFAQHGLLGTLVPQ